MTAPETRRARWEHIVDKHRRAGLPVEQAPIFLGWIEDWIAGSIEMSQVQQRYVAWKAASRASGHAALAADDRTNVVTQAAEDAFVAELSQEIPDISGLPIRDHETRRQSSAAIERAWDPE
jgi:hypothetical protein